MSKIFDVVIFGATGFTGQLVAEYFVESVDSSVRFALAGRSESKLKKVREDLCAINPSSDEIPLIVASISDVESLNAMTKQAKVLITTVGPYSLYGMPVVEACIRNNCDYVDLTGETSFMRQTISRFHKTAEEKGVAIVHTCGFDSIPSDIGTLFLVDYAKEKHGQKMQDVHGFVGKSKGGPSGGTIASVLNIIKSTPSKELKESMRPDCLNPKDAPKKQMELDLRFAKHDRVINKYVAPWFMEAVNTRVVRRSEAIRGDYGAQFGYTETMEMPSAIAAYAFSVLYICGILLLLFPPTRWLLEKFVLPSPGDGPSRETIVNGFFNIRMVGFTEASQGKPQRRLETLIVGKRDPGYGCTSRMLSESALFLLDRSQCRIGKSGGGVLTPASAFGEKFVPFLERAGVKISVTKDEEVK